MTLKEVAKTPQTNKYKKPNILARVLKDIRVSFRTSGLKDLIEELKKSYVPKQTAI